MEANKRLISDIFTQNRNIEIPFFQRSYVWKEDQWGRFLRDIENVCELNEPYFLGSIILKQQQTAANGNIGDIRTLIDGQQRLTTINILLKVLSLKSGNDSMFLRTFKLHDDTLILKHNMNDVESFEKILNLSTLDDITHTDNISNCYNYFKKHLDETKIDWHRTINNLLFVGIDLHIDEDEQQIFDSINSLGIKLTTAELLKNHLFDKSEVDLYKTQWQSVFEKDIETREFWDEEVTSGRAKRQNIDLFLYSFLQIKVYDKDLGITAKHKATYNKVDGLFNSYKHFMTNYIKDKASFVIEINDYAKLYNRNIDFTVIHRTLSNSGVDRVNAIMFGLETSTIITYILYILKAINSEEERTKIFDVIEGLVLRRMICKDSTRNYNEFFTERLIHQDVNTAEKLKQAIKEQAGLSNAMPSDSDLLDSFNNNKLTNKQTLGILYMLESKTRSVQMNSTALLGIKKYSLEHLMPKKWTNHWPDCNDHEQRDIKLLTLGNLTIITSSLNTSIRDANWNDKKEGRGKNKGLREYGSGIEIFTSCLNEDVWDESSIEKRAQNLYQKAIIAWPAN